MFSRLFPRFRANAAVVDALVRDTDDVQARWRPDADSWSILEVINHLVDEEVEDFRMRIGLTLEHPGRPWPPNDPAGWAIARSYNERDFGESVKRFRLERARSLAWLSELEGPDWSLTAPHPHYGTLSAGDLLVSWVVHDHLHIRQLNRLKRQYLVQQLAPDHAVEYAGNW